MSTDADALLRLLSRVREFTDVTLPAMRLDSSLTVSSNWTDDARVEYVERGNEDPLLTALRQTSLVDAVLGDVQALAESSGLMDEPARALLLEVTYSLMRQLWTRHAHVRTVVHHETSPAYTVLYAASWTHLTHAILLVELVESAIADGGDYDAWPIGVTVADNALPYVSLLGARGHESILVARGPVGEYTVDDWSSALSAFRAAYGRTGWSPAAARYFHILFLRYAMFLGGRADVASTAYDDPLLCVAEGADAEVSTAGVSRRRLELPGRLADAMVTEMERPLFHLMRHIMACEAFATHTPGSPLIGPLTPAWRNAANAGLLAWLRSVLADPVCGQRVSNQVRRKIVASYLFPGELEEADSVSASGPIGDDYDGVLYDARRGVYQRVSKFAADPIDTLFAQWTAHEARGRPVAAPPAESALLWDEVAVHRSEDECLALLILRELIGVAMKSHGCDPVYAFSVLAYVDHSTRRGAASTPPMSPQRLSERHGSRWPLFACVSRLYSVTSEWPLASPDVMDIDIEVSRQTWTTPHMTDAVCTWLYVVSRATNSAASLVASWPAELRSAMDTMQHVFSGTPPPPASEHA